jgi:putative nucleotidyltransferase with HDIG domain
LASFQLNPFSQIAIRVMQLVNDEAPIDKIMALISTDPAFVTDLLKISNSALYAHLSEVGTVFQAVSRIGTKHLEGICIAVAVRAYLGPSLSKPVIQRLWKHNLATAFIAEILATTTGTSKDVVFTGGILHDIGRVALITLHPTAYSALLAKYSGNAESILAVERDAFGADHCEIGGQVIAGWGLLPDYKTIATTHHCALDRTAKWDVASVINLACRMADSIGFPAFEGCESQPYAAVIEDLPFEAAQFAYSDAASLNSAVMNKVGAL